MNKVAGMVGEKVGDMVEGAVKSALGFKDKDKGKGKEEKGGGFLSQFGKDKKKDKKKDKEEDKGKGGFFSKVFDGDNDDGQKGQKKSGFAGLFSEGQQGGGAEGGREGLMMGGGGGGGGGEEAGFTGQSVAASDGDLMDDLMDVAQEMSRDS